MDITFPGVITKIATPEQVTDRQTGQPNGATRYRFLVEEQMQQYPDSVVVEIYDKTSDGSAITNAFQALGVQNPLQVGTIGIFHLNLRGKIDISPKTGKEYAMNYAADLWKVEPYNAQPAAQPFSAQGTQAAPVQQLQQPPQQQFNPAASAFAPQPPFQGQQPQPQFGGQAYQQVPY